MHHHLVNLERASICQSSNYVALESFPVLSQIEPQAPRLVYPSVNSFKFLPCDYTPPRTRSLMISLTALQPTFIAKYWVEIQSRHRLQ